LEMRPVIPELQYYYEALARAARLSRDDPDWQYTWRRLEELTSLVEQVAQASKGLGWDVHRPLALEGKRLVDSIEAGSHEVMRHVVRIEEEASVLAKKLAVAGLYVHTLRQIASILLTLAGATLLVAAETVVGTILAILATGIGLAALFLYKTPWSNLLLVPGLTAAIAAALLESVGDPELATLSLAILTGVLAIPLPKALNRLFLGEEGR